MIGGVIGLYHPRALPIALPFLAAWFLTGRIAAWLDQPWSQSESKVGTRDRDFLRETALPTWRFFDEFCSPVNHWLVPDRLQEIPSHLVERLSANKPGLASEFTIVRLRSGLHHSAAGDSTHESHDFHGDEDGARPRPFLQLV